MTTLSRQSQESAPRQENERQNLERRYGNIGISAVAAAACFKKPSDAPKSVKIPARFEEEAA